MKEVFLDSGIFIKLFDYQNLSGRKSSHEDILSIYESLGETANFVSTNIIVAEAFSFISNLALKTKGPYSIDNLLAFNTEYIETNLTVIYSDYRNYHSKALQIIQDFRFFKFNYADAITLAFLEDMGGYLTFTLDEAWQNFTFLKGYEIKNLEIVDIS